MFHGAGGLIDGAALDGEDEVAWTFAANRDDTGPVDHAIAAGAANGGAGHFAALVGGLLDGNVFGVDMDAMGNNALEPLVRVVATEVAVAGIKVDPDTWALYEAIDAIESIGMFA